MPTSPLPVPPPVVALAAAAAQYGLSRSSPSTAVSRMLAKAVAGGSLVLAAASVRSFRKAGTTVDPHAPARASTLVTGGVNSFTRNPMYVGLTGVLVAQVIWRRSVLALLPVAATVTLLDRTQIPAEEAVLRDRFGAEYDAYCSRVPRWIGIRRGQSAETSRSAPVTGALRK